MLDYWAEHDETLGTIVPHVLVHEIGHHFGLSDDGMYAIERLGRNTRSQLMKVDGGCHCGAITVEGEADPDRTHICHCTDCQTAPDRVSRFGAGLRR